MVALSDRVKELIDRKEKVCIELGCGGNKKDASTIGIDVLDGEGVDLVGDAFDVLDAFPDNSIDCVYAYHFIEHVPDVAKLLSVLVRVMRVDGILEFVAPHFSNPYFYSDPTHKSTFGLYTFAYLSDSSIFSRQVPSYVRDMRFQLKNTDLVFKSSRPFYIRYLIKSLWGKIFNSCAFMRELYEENFCYLIPCYEVKYVLVFKG